MKRDDENGIDERSHRFFVDVLADDLSFSDAEPGSSDLVYLHRVPAPST
jgi:hypothetical protein